MPWRKKETYRLCEGKTGAIRKRTQWRTFELSFSFLATNDVAASPASQTTLLLY